MNKNYFLMFGLLLASLGSHAQWIYSYADAEKVAKATGKLLMVDFTASWCGPCKAMEAEVWSDPAVKAQMANMVMVKVDIDYDRETATKYGVQAVPNIVVAIPGGEPLQQEIGYQRIPAIISMLKSYPTNLSEVYGILFSKEKETDSTFCALGDAYCNVAKKAPEANSSRFFARSESAYKKAQKLGAKANHVAIRELAMLRSISLYLERGKPQKAVDALNKEVKVEELCTTSKPEAVALYMRAYLALNNKEEAKKYLQQLRENPGALSLLDRYKEEVKLID
jgi:thiol-disulfide isomerase/thioredoxin